MKSKLFYFLAFLVVVTGCDKIKDASEITLSTDLKADIPVVVPPVGKKSADQLGVVNTIEFTKTQDLTLTDNTVIQPYLEKIKSIDLNSLEVTVTGLTEDQTINSISLDVAGVGNIFTQTNITMSNNSFTPTIAAGTFDSVAAKLTSDRKVTLTVSGSASGPMSFTVSLKFGTEVIANVL
jgi:hypothetical protein